MATYYTQPEIIDRARLIAIGAGTDAFSSPLNDNDYIAEVLYPHVVKNVFLREARAGNPDVRAVQDVTVTNGVGDVPLNAIVETLCNSNIRMNPQTVSGVTWVAATDIITATAHGFWTGLPVTFSTSGALVGGGLSPTTTYYVIYLTANTFQIATSIANAIAGTAVNISAVESEGTITVTPTYHPSSFSYVPRYMDYVRPLPTVFGYWNARGGELYVRPAETTNVACFDGVVPFESAVFPRPVRKYTMASAAHDSEQFILSANWISELEVGDRVLFGTSSGATFPAQLTSGAYYFVSAWTVPTNKTATDLNVNGAADTVTVTSHGFPTGMLVTVTDVAGVVTGLSANTNYYTINVGTNTLAFATSRANAIAGTKIDIAPDGSGTFTIQAQNEAAIKVASTYANAIAGSHLAFDNTAFSGTFTFTMHDLALIPGTPVPQDIVEDVVIELAQAMRGEPPYINLGDSPEDK